MYPGSIPGEASNYFSVLQLILVRIIIGLCAFGLSCNLAILAVKQVFLCLEGRISDNSVNLLRDIGLFFANSMRLVLD
ncbi:hypothetical protein DPQ22_02210 [Candidatus Tokpelaia sp.]|nr:hypothetical protein DPQ22_02210 [Candidatus Tokpelaia sp.]